MEFTNPQTFNPDILFVYDPWNKDDNVCEPHFHDFLEISVILEGDAMYNVDGEQYHLGAGRVLLFNHGVTHSEYQLPGSFSHQLHIGIANVALEGLPRNEFPNTKALLDLGEYHCQFLDKAWLLMKEYCNQGRDYALMGKGLVIEMLVYILRSLEMKRDNVSNISLSKSAQRQQNLVNHAIYYLENNHSNDISLDTLAEELFVSPNHLSRVFSEHVGVSPIKYLIHTRLHHARELLRNEDINVKEVAEAVGYHDAYHFSKLFKKYYGLPPSRAKEIDEMARPVYLQN
ncbi:MAG: AraC family transcriptional regulator [Clostridiales Family XIII bacterium]|jgi:AraC-like DNA-binding protein|nr:AraC family transcriptional regulator [Clostridiales Family XIII bacterium]